MRDTLKLYAIFMIIWSCLEMVGGLCAGGFAAMAGTFLSQVPPGQLQQQSGGPPPEAMVAMVTGVYGCIGALALAVGILGLVSGIKIVKLQGGRLPGLIWCGINLLSIPIGTGLGIWGMIVLLNEESKAILEGGGAARKGGAHDGYDGYDRGDAYDG